MNSEIRDHIHAVGNGLQAAFDALDNIEHSLHDDIHYCKEAIRVSKDERLIVFEHFEKLKLAIKGLNEK